MGMFKMVRVSDNKIIGYAPGEIITYQLTLQNQGLADIDGTITLDGMKAVDGDGYTVQDSGASVVIDSALATFETLVVDAQHVVTDDELDDLGDEKSKQLTTSATFTSNEGDIDVTITSEPVVIRRPDYAVGFSMAETSTPINGTPTEPVGLKTNYLDTGTGLPGIQLSWTVTDGIPVTIPEGSRVRIEAGIAEYGYEVEGEPTLYWNETPYPLVHQGEMMYQCFSLEKQEEQKFYNQTINPGDVFRFDFSDCVVTTSQSGEQTFMHAFNITTSDRQTVIVQPDRAEIYTTFNQPA